MICIAGKNDIAVNCLEWLLEEQNVDAQTVCVCLNQNGDGFTSQRSLTEYSKQKNIAQVDLDDLYPIKELVFFSLEFDRLIKPEKFKSSELFNIHFSLLPAYRGMYTSAWPILNGEKHSGVTLHKIDAGIDSGDIVDQIEFKIEYNDTARDLYFNYMKYGETLFKSNFKNIIENNYRAEPQKEGGSYYSKNSIDYRHLEIDLQKKAEVIRNQIRAFHFKEYQLPQVKDHIIDSAEILTTPSNKVAGSILQIKEYFMDIATLDNDLRLHFTKL